ncbi:MAG: hypothetical protein A3C79_00705 [Candidatus Taylorbacteria bacterium RIFCSPHIGHO2_02_FULL_45_28]|uniref:Response regulatory domain-containing protein n=1 Tax=Candidatus Taylorbacteria bacterium RIFCSPHIGHO2_12_FULL_45_16 TaxID=1802315 RepID=A0A1G2MZA1_9BACT|nr:MAG: hypothetical protein A2830_01960 [Candidatus Taylorbacteria bacterium RIFCSPHIGHO2_01_FULL_44_110]OHA25540.1 MAG: hypothetical protein A3C79_00705 [Candidatus Taylorbacteria bacterium RIFCSPHIGHO2_02_FULL_45_28]OHA29207.1 MAG: hypothetical protein A3F51_01170 [Candidatus Taylorbacteria bacterium RIFCSPHIGHO2_12_FULL_45_16]OHA33429.1 MAG: hypothetical protein A3A23_02050 [Candidatus Taylorbacteria bacterium RIFCSPLOWO2_01_FULL_45_59]OHA39239.1 MAG: hypothetical protein A3I98_02235 [Candi
MVGKTNKEQLKTKLNILVVEFEADVRKTALRILEHDGHIVTTASNGEEAYSLVLISEADERPYDLILTDYKMGHGMTGIELAKRIQSGSRTYVIWLWSGTSETYFGDLTSFGISRFISKPIGFGILLRLLAQDFEKTQTVAGG